MSSSRDRMDCTRLPLPRTAHISTNPYTAHSACDLPAPLHFYRAMQKRPPQTQAMQEVLTDMAIDDALLAQEFALREAHGPNLRAKREENFWPPPRASPTAAAWYSSSLLVFTGCT